MIVVFWIAAPLIALLVIALALGIASRRWRRLPRATTLTRRQRRNLNRMRADIAPALRRSAS